MIRVGTVFLEAIVTGILMPTSRSDFHHLHPLQFDYTIGDIFCS